MLKSVWIDYVCNLVLMFCGVCMIVPRVELTAPRPQVYFNWTKDNERFKPDEGASLSVAVGTNLVIKCPYMTDPPEYYIIYWVSAQGFRECFRPDNASKLLVKCDRPTINLEWIQQIQTFSGVPGGKDFKIGEHYYLATFSTGTLNGIRNDIGGACEDRHMKLNLTITAQVPPSTSGPTNITTTRSPVTSTPRPTTRSTQRPTTRVSSTTERTTHRKTTQKPHTTDIPPYTDIPVISVPDPNTNGNTGVIDISSGAQIYPMSYCLVLSLCLSLVHILYHNFIYVHR